MGTTKAVTDATFTDEVLMSSTPVLVDFWAEWCGPCLRVAPVLEEIAREMGDKVKIVKLDIDANPNVARDYRIMSVPTLTVFKGGSPGAVGGRCPTEERPGQADRVGAVSPVVRATADTDERPADASCSCGARCRGRRSTLARTFRVTATTMQHGRFGAMTSGRVPSRRHWRSDFAARRPVMAT